MNTLELTNAETSARQQIGTLHDTIDMRQVDQLSSIGAYFANILVRISDRAGSEAPDIMEAIIDKHLMYPLLLEKLSPTEQTELDGIEELTWENVLFHAQVCQRLLDTNI